MYGTSNYPRSEAIGCVLVLVCTLAFLPSASAGVIFGSNGNLGGGYRWDAASRIIGGNERSLNGGLRYSVQGGSYAAYRDLFTWTTTPTESEFQTAVQQAFSAWESVDPVTGLGTQLSFVNDIANTAVVGTESFGLVNSNGAEIDLLGFDAGDNGTRAIASFNVIRTAVTLTSGTSGYGFVEGGGAISGADIVINTNPGAVYSLDVFRRLLTHELGHALGLGDVEDFFSNGFIDDNYDGTDASTAEATLNNSWALLVDPLNPAASVGLTQFAPGVVQNGNPGLDTPGVDILMESQGLGIGTGNPLSNLVPLTNDDYGTRQFLYPMIPTNVIPEPSSVALFGIGMTGILVYFRRKK